MTYVVMIGLAGQRPYDLSTFGTRGEAEVRAADWVDHVATEPGEWIELWESQDGAFGASRRLGYWVVQRDGSVQSKITE